MTTSLQSKLILSFLVVSIVGMLVVGAFVGTRTTDRFNRYITDQYLEAITARLGQYYAARGTWDGVAQALQSPQWRRMPFSLVMPPPGNPWRASQQSPLLVTDDDGRVVLPGLGQSVGATVPRAVLAEGAPIVVDGATVGHAVLRVRLEPRLENLFEQGFLPDFYRALLIGTAGATALALLVGIALATSLTRPIRELTHATQAMARGELEQEIPVRSQDELGQLAASFNQMSAELARGERVRKQMTADIAHELRTPLSLILGHAEAIRDGVLPATPETLDIVYDEARRLTHLVEDLNTLSLSDAGRLPLHREPVSPAGLLQRAAAAHRPRALARDIALDVDAQDDLPRISADPVRMAQVLDNLLSNAMRYTPRGGRIHLAARQVDGELRLVIQDSGPGIPPEDLARIFDRFYRADKSRQRNEGGSGLGLAIARSIVEGHGGRLWAENAPTGGARFVIALPVTQSPREA